MSNDKKLTVGGLFSGIGGIERAFEKANFTINWANEIDKHACKTYRFNHKKHLLIEDSIYNVNPQLLSKVDILVGGFPCQAFSISGQRKGFSDPRGNVFYQIEKFIHQLPKKPQVLMLENVKNLSTHDQGRTKIEIEKIIKSHGYLIDWNIYNTCDYTNIPQNRERTIIVCFQKRKAYDYFKNNPIKKTTKRKKIQELLENKIDDKYYYNNAYNYKELKKIMKRQDTIYQWRRVYTRENQNNLCPTLTANMGTGGHNVPLILDDRDIRKLTPKECFRFQGFNSIKFPKDVPITQLYKQAGNSVTIDLIYKIAKKIKLSIT